MTTREWTCEAAATKRSGTGCGSSIGVSPRPMIQSAPAAWKKESRGIENSVLGVLLHDAVARGDALEASDLLRKDANPDHCRDSGKITPLMLAISSIRRDLVRLLLDAQADPTKKDADGLDAMDRLALAEERLCARSEGIERRMTGISELLQRDGAAMTRREKELKLAELGSGQEELDDTIKLQNECQAIGKMIEKKLDAILLEAAQSDDLERAVAAIEAGADPISFDREGRSPYLVARDRGFAGLAAYLKKDLDENLASLMDGGSQDEIMAALRAGAEPIKQ